MILFGGERVILKHEMRIKMIRKAKEEDVERIMALLKQVNRIHHVGRPDLFRKREKYTMEELKGILADAQRPILVATYDTDELLGYAFCVIEETSPSSMMVPHKTLYVDDLCVDERIRGQHVGSALFNAVKEYAKQNGCYRVTLNVWNCNPDAMVFYERMGMRPYKVAMEQIL